MLKWLGGMAILFVVASMFVTVRYQRSCDELQAKSREEASTLIHSVKAGESANQSPHTEECPVQTYKFLSWPEGITVWALLLTLVAFVWQASLMEKHADHFKNLAGATAESAEATKSTTEGIQRQAKELSRQNKNMISRERARIAVRILPIGSLNFYDGNFIRLQIENIGPTHALNVRTIGEVRPVLEGAEPAATEPDELFYATEDIYGTGDSSIPGVQSIVRANAKPSEGRLVLLFPEEWKQEIEENDPMIVIDVWGSIQYEDVFGQKHSTKFHYLLNLITTRDLPFSKPFNPHPFTRWRTSLDPQENHAD